MKHVLLLVFCLSFLIGCQSNHVKPKIGPLTQIEGFEVFAFFSPYEKFDRDALFKTLVENLTAIGSVEVIEDISQFSKIPTLFLLSLGGYEQENEGSIEIVTSVEVEANKFKTTCPIWKTHLHKGFPYPVIEDDKVVFKREDESSLAVTNDPLLVLKQMIENFSKEYQNCNLEGVKPKFFVYSGKAI